MAHHWHELKNDYGNAEEEDNHCQCNPCSNANCHSAALLPGWHFDCFPSYPGKKQKTSRQGHCGQGSVSKIHDSTKLGAYAKDRLQHFRPLANIPPCDTRHVLKIGAGQYCKHQQPKASEYPLNCFDLLLLRVDDSN
mmetsp:Transcript_26525/g.43530  ORF Transcript_26525/g.43530 Transcript_26525/m.43530 type:complete len:137 (+) Transcript_26525:179-589(+)